MCSDQKFSSSRHRTRRKITLRKRTNSKLVTYNSDYVRRNHPRRPEGCNTCLRPRHLLKNENQTVPPKNWPDQNATWQPVATVNLVSNPNLNTSKMKRIVDSKFRKDRKKNPAAEIRSRTSEYQKGIYDKSNHGPSLENTGYENSSILKLATK